MLPGNRGAKDFSVANPFIAQMLQRQIDGSNRRPDVLGETSRQVAPFSACAVGCLALRRMQAIGDRRPQHGDGQAKGGEQPESGVLRNSRHRTNRPKLDRATFLGVRLSRLPVLLTERDLPMRLRNVHRPTAKHNDHRICDDWWQSERSDKAVGMGAFCISTSEFCR